MIWLQSSGKKNSQTMTIATTKIKTKRNKCLQYRHRYSTTNMLPFPIVTGSITQISKMAALVTILAAPHTTQASSSLLQFSQMRLQSTRIKSNSQIKISKVSQRHHRQRTEDIFCVQESTLIEIFKKFHPRSFHLILSVLHHCLTSYIKLELIRIQKIIVLPLHKGRL